VQDFFVLLFAKGKEKYKGGWGKKTERIQRSNREEEENRSEKQKEKNLEQKVKKEESIKDKRTKLR
jgi:hypothetical protein